MKEGIVMKITIALSTTVCECFWKGWGPLVKQREPRPSRGRDHSQGNSYHKPWTVAWHTLCFLSLSLSFSFSPLCWSVFHHYKRAKSFKITLQHSFFSFAFVWGDKSREQANFLHPAKRAHIRTYRKHMELYIRYCICRDTFSFLD